MSRPTRADWLLSVALLLIIWQIAAATRIFPVQILVPPLTVWRSFRELWHDGDIQSNLAVSLVRLLSGYFAGAVSGLAFGLLLGLSRRADDVLGLLFQMLRQIPVVAMVPLLMVVFGIEDVFKITMVAIATFFPVALNTYDGVKSLPKPLGELATALCFNHWSMLRRVVLPHAIPSIVTGLRLALSRAWLILVAAELLASTDGIGYLIDWGRQLFQIDIVLVGIIIAGLIGLLLDSSLQFAERKATAWR